MSVEVGDKAPDFSLPADKGGTVSLKALKGNTVVLYFYPKDDTPGCTTQACEFRDALPDFKKIKAVVLGISPDEPKMHRKFVDKFELNFTLLADPQDPVDNRIPPVCYKYGVWQEKSMYGRKFMGVARTTYIIGPAGKILRRFDRVKPENHAREILNYLNQDDPA